MGVRSGLFSPKILGLIAMLLLHDVPAWLVRISYQGVIGSTMKVRRLIW